MKGGEVGHVDTEKARGTGHGKCRDVAAAAAALAAATPLECANTKTRI